MAKPKFLPITDNLFGETATGEQFLIFGWWTADDWLNIEPVVANPDGPGMAAWRFYFGSDPWKVVGRKIEF